MIMPTLTRKCNQIGDLVTGYLAVTNSATAALPYGRNSTGATASYTGAGYIQKLIITNANAADNVLTLTDNGSGGSDAITIFAQFLHQVDLQENSGAGLSSAFTTKAEIIDFPEPGLFFHGNLKAVSSQSSGIHMTIIAKQAQEL